MKVQQLSLLTETRAILQAGAVVPVVKAAMRRVAEESPLSREQGVDAMNAIIRASGKRVTAGRAAGISKDTLDKWLSPEESVHVPTLQGLHVFCLAYKSTAPLIAWFEALGEKVEVMTEEDRYLRDYGRTKLKRKLLAEEEREIEMKLKKEARR